MSQTFLTCVAMALAIVLLPVSGAVLAAPPDLGPNVLVLSPSDAGLQAKLDTLFQIADTRERALESF